LLLYILTVALGLTAWNAYSGGHQGVGLTMTVAALLALGAATNRGTGNLFSRLCILAGVVLVLAYFWSDLGELFYNFFHLFETLDTSNE
jgi:hypothetical protein